jgi:hypothetical protein
MPPGQGYRTGDLGMSRLLRSHYPDRANIRFAGGELTVAPTGQI